MVALWNRADHYIFALWFLSSFSFSFFFFSSPNLKPSQIGCLLYFHIWCDLSANLECRSEMYCTRLAGNAGRTKSPKDRRMGTTTTLSGYIFASKARIDSRKKLLSSNISSICPHNMVNFSLLAAEIVSLVWGTPANINGFRVLASLLQRRRSTEANQTFHNVWPLTGLVDYIYIFGGCSSVTEFCLVQNSLCVLQVLRLHIGSVTARQSSSGREPNFAALSTGCHLYSAGRPSRWAFAHILVVFSLLFLIFLFMVQCGRLS